MPIPNVVLAIAVWCVLVGTPLAEAASPEPKALQQLQAQLVTGATTNSAERVKRALLELALERARNAHDVGLHEEVQALANDLKRALPRAAAEFARRNPDAAHLGILKPLLSKQENPYLDAMVQKAREDLAKPDLAWFRATSSKPTFSGLGGAYGVRTAGTKMREYFWLFAHEQSPMRGDPELLKRALRRAHAYIDGLTLDSSNIANRPEFYDQFAIEESFSGLYEIIELHPGLLLPSQRLAWDRALKKASVTLWKQMRNARAWNLNIETSRMVGVLNMGYYSGNEEMVAKVMSHVDAVLKRMRPDGAWPYHGEGNPSVNYHSALLGSLLLIYEQTGYEPIAKALEASQWKGPVMGRTDEFWTSPFFKTYRWNFKNGTEAGPEAVAALSKNPYVRWLRDRTVSADRNQVAWYRGDVKPRPLPDRYTIPDRNVGGPRAWYGNFTYAGTFRRTSPNNVAGHETVMGAMTVDAKDGRLNSILTGINPRIWMLPKDSKDHSAWGVLTTELAGATTITRNYSVSTAVHGITAIRKHAYRGPSAKGWKGRQIWIGLPDRLLGLVSVVAGDEGAKAYAVNGVLRLISGGATGAETTKQLETITERHFRYGQLDILVHDTTYKSLTPVIKQYRNDNYPATELTFSNREKEPGPAGKVTHFPAETEFHFVVEIRPTWTTSSVDVKTLSDQHLVGVQVLGTHRGLQVWLNASVHDRKCTIKRKQLPRGRASFSLSDGVLGQSPFNSELPSTVTLRPGQHAVLVVSPDPLDHTSGWKSFAEMIRSMPQGNEIKTNKAIDDTSQ
jgi:hypothetical protein